MKIKKGDKIIFIAGKERGKTGTVLRAIPKRDMVVIEGLNLYTKHQRATRTSKAQIIEKVVPVHVSNVQLVDAKSGKGTRVRIDRKNGRARVAVKGGSVIK